MEFTDQDRIWMMRALEIAANGLGFAAPNPLVGCVIVRDDQVISEGWHAQCGGDHAEVMALLQATGSLEGATVFVNLEPCSHHGRTPPCADSLIASGIARVIIANEDPFEQVSGQGIARLRSAGIDVTTGLLAEEGRELNRAYFKRVETGRPWVIAKWAMSLDGRIATRSGDSKWISNEQSREIVQQIRGLVDAVIVGRGTALADDPMLTARPASGTPARIATRIVIDSGATLPLDSQLVRTAAEAPVLVCAGPEADESKVLALESAGVDVFRGESPDRNERLNQLLEELGRRDMTRVLVEGGGELLGSLNDIGQIDEVHTFIGPRIIGGSESLSPLGGSGAESMSAAPHVNVKHSQQIGDDLYVWGIVDKRSRGK